MKYLFEILSEEQLQKLIEILINEISADRVFASGLLYGICLTIIIEVAGAVFIDYVISSIKKAKRKENGNGN